MGLVWLTSKAWRSEVRQVDLVRDPIFVCAVLRVRIVHRNVLINVHYLNNKHCKTHFKTGVERNP